MKINTSQTHADLNGPKIVAKSMGKQKSTPYDHSISHDANHGVAAANLILHMFDNGYIQGSDVAGIRIRIDSGTAIHAHVGAKHAFIL